jgi:ABC transporter ATM
MPLNFLGSIYREIRQSLTDLDAMFSLVKLTSQVKDDPDAKPLVLKGGEIEFKNVSFGYPTDHLQMLIEVDMWMVNRS